MGQTIERRHANPLAEFRAKTVRDMPASRAKLSTVQAVEGVSACH